jgi:hypothetical protein
MKTSLKFLLAAGVISVAGLTAIPASAASVGLSFRGDDVVIGYQDGYYDRSHNWHHWRNARDHRWYRAHYAQSYRGMRHDRDHDGIPNRFDRDRDNDGVPNRYDSRPNNPYRN